MHNLKLSFFMILFTLTFAGCKTIELQTINLPLRSTLIKGPAVAGNLSDMPDDAAKTVSAIAAILTGKSPSADIDISPFITQNLNESAIHEHGFALEAAKLYQYQIGDNSSIRIIDAVTGFKDRLDRRYQSRIKARYSLDGNHTRILEADASPYFDRTPRTVCFIMPAEKLPCRADTLPDSFAILYERAARHALTPQQAASTSTPKNWGMAVFYLDRVSTSAKVKLGVSADIDGSDGYTEGSRYVDYNGWRVAFAAGKYTLMDHDSNSPLLLKASYTPGNEAGLLKHSATVGLFRLTR